VVSRRADSNR